MDEQLRDLLDELAEFGRQNDARETERGRRMLNITPNTGEFLSILVRATGAKRILEIGMSNGYSTIWLARAAREIGGYVLSIERAADKIALARANLQRAGLADRVTIAEGAAIEVIASLPGPHDLIFLDADRPTYLTYLDLLIPRLRVGGLLVTDNVVSHAHELTEFLPRVKGDARLDSVTLPIGNGVELTYRCRD